ncbi:hypothetical protein Ancab_001586, partial [Ancistrocladus abbreviatus]
DPKQCLFMPKEDSASTAHSALSQKLPITRTTPTSILPPEAKPARRVMLNKKQTPKLRPASANSNPCTESKEKSRFQGQVPALFSKHASPDETLKSKVRTCFCLHICQMLFQKQLFISKAISCH